MDSLKVYDQLKQVNFDEGQAKVLAVLFSQFTENDPPSKRDLSETELRLQKEIRNLDLKITDVEAQLKKDIHELDLRMKDTENRIIETVSASKVDTIKWVGGMLLANTTLILLLSRLLR